MAIQGSYRINFTDPKNGSFVIEPYTVDGNVTATSDILHGKATKATTSLQLPGQYVPNYGEMVHENLVHLLENFAGDTPPTNSIEGQLWYDTGSSYAIVDVSSTGCTLKGNASAAFGGYITAQSTLVAWYGPVSVSDNSYNSIQFKATEVLVNSDNNTVVTITAVDGTQVILPNSSVGGFVTLLQESRIGRLKVALNVNGSLTWGDVVNVQCALTAPTPESLQNGDLWYDLSTSQLKLYLNSSWVSITGNYLPLAGGTMTGTINMGTNPILYTGAVSTSSTLTNKSYVDTAITTAIAQASNNGAVTDLQGRMTSVETSVAQKINKAGDNVTGVLVFGPTGTTTTATAGIDMVSKPIVNPSITWSASDYLTVVGETHNVIDKNYLSLALKQHMIDVVHGGASFIEEQSDGRGLIAAPIYFSDSANTLMFDVNNTSYGLSTTADALVITTGSWLGSKITFQQSGASTKLFEIADTASRSFNSIYLLDGQPQPNFVGAAATAENNDTKVATKGFVTDALTTKFANVSSVTGATFSYTAGVGPYNLVLTKSSGDPITVDLNHTHTSSTITHAYVPLFSWAGGTTDLVSDAIGGVTSTNVGVMLTALNQTKAPISGAKFADAPMVGATATATAVRDSDHTFALSGTDQDLVVVGAVLRLTWDDTSNLDSNGDPTPVSNEYTITNISVEQDSNSNSISYYTTTPVFPTGHDINAEPITVIIPLLDDGTDGRRLLNKASVDTRIKASLTSSALSPIVQPIVEVLAGASRVINLADTTATFGTDFSGGMYARFTNSAAITLTIPAGLDATQFPIGIEFSIKQAGTGAITISPASGVTVNAAYNGTLVTPGKGATMRLKRVATAVWDIL